MIKGFYHHFRIMQLKRQKESDEIEENSTVLLTDVELPSTHLTQQEYEDSLISSQFDNGEEEEIFQNEPQKKYDLRPRSDGPKENTPVQNKKAKVSAKQGPTKDTGNKSDQPQQPIKVVSPEVKET
jgi:hypothetical protein